MRDVLVEEFGGLQLDADDKASPEQINDILSRTLKGKMEEFLDAREKRLDALAEFQETAGGQYAK